MLFEEFFKKKRIDLAALQAAEGGLFSEFKDHFEQMGEKSFDHTKKYWFNKLRRRFPIAAEIKTERVHIANPLAEQTITESLIEPGTPSSKIGFTPKFRAAVPARPTDEKPEEVKPIEEAPSADNTVPKPAFKPRFNPAMVKPKPAEPADSAEEKPVDPETGAMPPAETPVVNPGFKPRFNAGMMKPKPVENEEETPASEPELKEETSVIPVEAPAAKPGFKPRFNAAMMKPKPAENIDETPTEQPELKAEETAAPAAGAPIAKPGFKPRFNAAMMKPKAAEEQSLPKLPEAKEEPGEVTELPDVPTDVPAAKLGFKPRFNAAAMKPKPEEEIIESTAPESNETPAASVAEPEDTKPADEATKPAYKPKFNIKNLPKKPGQE